MASLQLIVLFMVPSAVGVLILSAMVYRRNAMSRRAVSADMVRMPGQRLMQQIVDRQQNMMAMFLVLMGGPLWLVGAMALASQTAERPINWWLVGILTLTIAIWGITSLIRTGRSLFDLHTGLSAELDAAYHLNQLMLKGYRVFHDVPCEGFNIDHVAVGANGVFAIETKGRRKTKNQKAGHKVLLTGEGLKFPRGMDTSSIDQAQRQARWLANWLSRSTGESCTAVPILCIPGWFIERLTKPPFPICNSKTVGPAITGRQGDQLLQPQIQRIAHQLERLCSTSSSPLQPP